MPNLTYIALTEYIHEDGKTYPPGSDISHFAPLIPWLESHISVGRIQLVDPEGTATRPRFEVRMDPRLFGLMTEDIAAAQAQGVEASPAPAGETPSGDEPPEPGFDPADHTIAEVLDYLDENPDALQDVIALEASGKARSTLLAKLEALAGDDE